MRMGGIRIEVRWEFRERLRAGVDGARCYHLVGAPSTDEEDAALVSATISVQA